MRYIQTEQYLSECPKHRGEAFPEYAFRCATVYAHKGCNCRVLVTLNICDNTPNETAEIGNHELRAKAKNYLATESAKYAF